MTTAMQHSEPNPGGKDISSVWVRALRHLVVEVRRPEPTFRLSPTQPASLILSSDASFPSSLCRLVDPVKPVSKCKGRCGKRYDAISRQDEYGACDLSLLYALVSPLGRGNAIPAPTSYLLPSGHGEFKCKCGNTWTNGRSQWTLVQDCHRCACIECTPAVRP